MVRVVVPPGKETRWTRVGVFSSAGYRSTGNVRIFVTPRRTSTPGTEEDIGSGGGAMSCEEETEYRTMSEAGREERTESTKYV